MVSTRRSRWRELGQNFLVDRNILDVIGRLAELSANDVVLEVGGGVGVLSSYLEQSLRLFLSQKPPTGDPPAAATHLAHQNHQRWHSAQEEIFRTLMKAANSAPATTTSS